MRLMLNVTNIEGRFNNLHVFISNGGRQIHQLQKSVRAGEGTREQDVLSSLCTKVETSRIKLKYDFVVKFSGPSNPAI